MDSNTAGAAFNFTRCGVKDISRPLSDLEKYPAIKIKISKGFSFANLDTEYEFEEQRSQFFQEHETKDDYMEGREGMDLINVDFKEYVIAFKDPNNLPWYVSRAVFWVGSLILLSWPLRAIIEFKTAHLHYHIHKLFGSNYLGSEHCPGLISRVSTMNSTEFEMSIRNNNVIVPSYSEAMLVDIYEQQQRNYGAIKAYPSKFPRSLTNATLAGRSSWRTTTPTVMMNKVKKFKSCNVLENIESSDLLLRSGSFRYHVRQLVRERGRQQTKTTLSLSHCNIPGSLSNENVIQNNCSIGTSEGLTSASICYYHCIETPNIGTLSCDGAISRLNEARCNDLDVQIITSMRSNLPNRHLRSPLRLSKSGPVSDSTGLDILNQIPPLPVHGSSVESLSNIPAVNSPPTPFNSECYNVNKRIFPRTPTTSPPKSTPSSPPAYEEAIKMRQISPSLISQPALISVGQAAEIGFTGKSSSVLSAPSTTVTTARPGRDDKGSTNVVLVAGSIDSEIDSGESAQLSEINNGDSKDNNCHLQPTSNLEGGKCNTNLLASRHLQQQLLSNKLKPLPRVSQIVHSDAEDSDIGCLHGTHSEFIDSDNVPGSAAYLSNRTSQLRSFQIGSISSLAASLIAQDGISDPATSLNQRLNRSTPSASVSSTAVTQSRASRLRTCSGNRMETSV